MDIILAWVKQVSGAENCPISFPYSKQTHAHTIQEMLCNVTVPFYEIFFIST